MKLSDISSVYQKLFALFIGRSNSGKTVAAASMPKPLLEMDFDYRANGIVNAVSQGWLSDEKIEIERFDPFKGFIPVQTFLNTQYTFVTMKQFQYESLDIGSADSLVRLLDLSALNAPNLGHLNIAGNAMTGPADYKFESQTFHKIVDYLRVLPCHITMSVKILNAYGKRPGAKDTDSMVIIGEKLALGTDKLAESILGSFNDVYKFTKEMINGVDKYFVEFNTEISRNSYGIPPGKFDITKKNFWEEFQKIKKGEVKPTASNTGGFLQL